MGQITTTRQARLIRRGYLRGRYGPLSVDVPHSPSAERAYWRGYQDKLDAMFSQALGISPTPAWMRRPLMGGDR